MNQITYGSVCSGIEAASVAWEPLGWKPLWFSEIEPFPSGVLAHHWPQVPNLGDFTGIRHKLAEGSVEAPDVLVGGTPCQAYSVAGLRKSLDDARGQLTLQFVGLANAIDDVRSLRGRNPCTVVWENVPGVLSTKDNAFGCFLADLVGAEEALIPGACPNPGKSSAVWRWDGKSGKHVPSWPVRGVVSGPRRSLAWRVLDAQWFGVAQRRRRVFVVASAGAICPEKVLFEFDGVRRDSPPSREAGKGSPADAGRGAGQRSHWEGGPHPSLNQSNNIGGVGMSNQEIFSQRGAYLDPCLQASGKAAGSATQQDAENGALVVAASFDTRNGLAAHGSTELRDIANPLRASDYKDPQIAVCATGDVFHTLRAEGCDASEDGTGRGAGAIAVSTLAIRGRGDGCNLEVRSDGTSNAILTPSGGRAGIGCGAVAVAHVDIMPTMTSGGPKGTSHGQVSGQMRDAYMVPMGMQVRRLTPDECAALQGFPKGHARIPWNRGYWPKGSCSEEARAALQESCPDGPQYKAYGNSMCTKVMFFIGKRLNSAILSQQQEPRSCNGESSEILASQILERG